MNNTVNIKDVIEKKKLKGINKDIQGQVKSNWDAVAKPIDSMGVFETFHSQMGGILGKSSNILDKSAILVFCADNGIVEEGVSQSGQEITAICADNISRGNSCLGVMAKAAKCDIITVDVGINGDKDFEFVHNYKIRKGTRNFLKEPAMTREELYKALQVGMDMIKACQDKGYSCLGIGEMGIGNTTTSSALAAALLKLKAERVTGRGAGLSDKGLERKKLVIDEAITRYDLYNMAAIDVLATVGGFDIAAMVGACIGGAYFGMPIVLDGFISNVAALCAETILPGVKEYLIPSHGSREPGALLVTEKLGLTPVIQAGMALGEGTGAALMISLLRTSDQVYRKSLSFEGYEIEQYTRL